MWRESYNSNSNKIDIEPLYIDFTIPFYIDYTTVFQNESILTEWTELHESFMSYYNIGTAMGAGILPVSLYKGQVLSTSIWN